MTAVTGLVPIAEHSYVGPCCDESFN